MAYFIFSIASVRFTILVMLKTINEVKKLHCLEYK